MHFHAFVILTVVHRKIFRFFLKPILGKLFVITSAALNMYFGFLHNGVVA
jgi:hypothetical protein